MRIFSNGKQTGIVKNFESNNDEFFLVNERIFALDKECAYLYEWNNIGELTRIIFLFERARPLFSSCRVAINENHLIIYPTEVNDPHSLRLFIFDLNENNYVFLKVDPSICNYEISTIAIDNYKIYLGLTPTQLGNGKILSVNLSKPHKFTELIISNSNSYQISAITTYRDDIFYILYNSENNKAYVWTFNTTTKKTNHILTAKNCVNSNFQPMELYFENDILFFNKFGADNIYSHSAIDLANKNISTYFNHTYDLYYSSHNCTFKNGIMNYIDESGYKIFINDFNFGKRLEEKAQPPRNLTPS